VAAPNTPTADASSPAPAAQPGEVAMPSGDAIAASADNERLRQLRSTLVELRRDLRTLLEAVDG
jgi:hypothetical protein